MRQLKNNEMRWLYTHEILSIKFNLEKKYARASSIKKTKNKKNLTAIVTKLIRFKIIVMEVLHSVFNTTFQCLFATKFQSTGDANMRSIIILLLETIIYSSTPHSSALRPGISADSSASIIPLQSGSAHSAQWLTVGSSNEASADLSGLRSPLLLLLLLLVRLCCSPAPLARLQSLRGAEEQLDKLPAMEGDNIIMPVWLGEISFQGKFGDINRGGGRERRGSCACGGPKSLSASVRGTGGKRGGNTPMLFTVGMCHAAS